MCSIFMYIIICCIFVVVFANLEYSVDYKGLCEMWIVTEITECWLPSEIVIDDDTKNFIKELRKTRMEILTYEFTNFQSCNGYMYRGT